MENFTGTDYESVKRAIDTMNETRHEMVAAINSMESLINEIKPNWVGTDAEQYCLKMEGFIGRLKKAEDLMNNITWIITCQNEEMNNKRLAREAQASRM